MKHPITGDLVRQLVMYDPGTGIFLWRSRPVHHRLDKTWNTRYAGKPAGIVKDLYIRIAINRRLYYAHQLAFIYITDHCPKYIDHINRDKHDNRWNNLREVTARQNTMNVGLRVNNKSGHRGVCWNTSRNRWQAAITVNYRQITLGYFPHKQDAILAYQSAAHKHFGEFASCSM
jgi:HNH endonuclease/AP2 domain